MGPAEVTMYLYLLCMSASERYGVKHELEHRFDKARRWRFDAAFPELMIAVEIDGGVWSGGRHTRGKGFIKDLEKMNAAALKGWKVFRFTTEQLRLGEVGDFIDKAIESELKNEPSI